MAQAQRDALTGMETTGHEWDGIQELNTPLPKWWLYVFYATIVFSVIYCFFYPAWPLPGGGVTQGVLNYSSREQHNRALEQQQANRAIWADELVRVPLDEVEQNPDLLQIAMAGGKVVFANNCAPCHGTGATGRPGGYPSLIDDDWIWGGSLDAIHTTIVHGIRNVADPDARSSQMPAYGADGLLTPQEISDVADHVLFLAGRGADNAKGAAIYAEQCAACHGDIGQGNQELGAPALRDKIWLYGDTREAIVAQINRPRMGVMPPWSGRLTPNEIKQVTIYVHSLGGGQ